MDDTARRWARALFLWRNTSRRSCDALVVLPKGFLCLFALNAPPVGWEFVEQQGDFILCRKT